MVQYNKYLTEGRNYASSNAEAAIERMEDLLADFEIFIEEKLQSAGNLDVDVKTLKSLKSQFYRSFDKQWESFKKDLVMFGKKLDNLK